MAQQQSSAYAVQVVGLDECLRVLTKAGSQLHDLDASRVRLANSTLRREAKVLADDFGRTVVAPLFEAHGGPQGPKMADTIRGKADRIPIVRVGATNPKLSGFKSRRGRKAVQQRQRHIDPSRWKGSLAWGAEFGPHPSNSRNPYGRGRSGGYVIGPRQRQLADRLAPLYVPLLAEAMETAGWPVADRRSG